MFDRNKQNNLTDCKLFVSIPTLNYNCLLRIIIMSYLKLFNKVG